MQQNLDDFAHLEKLGIAAEQELADKAQLALIAQLREGLKDRFQADFVQRCQPGIGLVPGGFESKGALPGRCAYNFRSRRFCPVWLDRKSTRLNSSHVAISY